MSMSQGGQTGGNGAIEASNSEKREIGRASGVMAVFTLISRVLGLVRNQILGHFFGAGFIADAFIAAFTIPNALRRLFGEGALTPAFVSTMTRAHHEAEKKNDPEIWKSYLANAFYWLSICLVILCGLGMLFAPWLVQLYVPNFKAVPGKFELTVDLTRFLFPFILFIGWSAFFMGALNTFRSFGLPAFGPALLNICVIVIVPIAFKFYPSSGTNAIYVFSGAMLVGGLAQAIVQLPKLLRLGASFRRKFNWADQRVIELGKILLPSAFAMSVYQLNIIINRIFASKIEGAVSHLFYSDLILELPVSLIAVSLGTAVLPSFSRLLTQNDRKGLATTFEFSLESVWLLSIPSMIGLISLSLPITSTLYFSGKFNSHDLLLVSSCLVTYAFGLPLFAGLRIITPAFIAEKDTRTPALVGLVSLVVNFICAWSFSNLFGTTGIALATSVSSLANFLILMVIIRNRYPEISLKRLFYFFARVFAAALAMGYILFATTQTLGSEIWMQHGISFKKVGTLAFLLFIGCIVFYFASKLLKIPHLDAVISKIKKKFIARAS